MSRCYRPAVGRWVLEFPSGLLQPDESPAAGGARVVRQLTGHGASGWQTLGTLRPNPGYSDELMTLGLMAMEAMEREAVADAEREAAADAEAEEGMDGDETTGPQASRLWTARALEGALASLDEAVDGRSVSAWFLARQRGGI
jgi:ADP-ribose pyrophosphatase